MWFMADEKYFCLYQKQHKQEDEIWSSVYPHKTVENNNRSDEKGMIFVAIVAGKA